MKPARNYIFLDMPQQMSRQISFFKSLISYLQALHPLWHIAVLHFLTTIVLWPFVRDYPGEPVPKETLTHSHLSSITPYLLPPSNMIHSILLVQFTCLTVFLHNLCPSPLWSTSWSDTLHFIFHTFLHPIIVFFLQHMPIPT